ncbi:MAG TPA: ATP-grasp domain-containing protein [Candidatus Polarisedimenticolaceae bacterium]|nr:ATP-grasp domain-containing protein [Candidatus Polarisedimenticolaceae bacterium]
MPASVLLLIPTTSYKTDDFMRAAARLDVELIVGTDRRQALEAVAAGHTLAFDLRDTARALDDIERLAARRGLHAVLGVDDETTLLATLAAARLGLPHNPIEAVRATRDKYEMRRLFSRAGLFGPAFERLPLDVDPVELASGLSFPGVLKPVGLAGSRGVIRVDDRSGFVRAFRRIAAILDDAEVRRLKGVQRHLLFERYLPGAEYAVEGLLDRGRLHVLALFDKPDPLVGPYFEETLLVTPSRASEGVRRALADETHAGCRALGLVHGPLHAELRVSEGRPWLIEIAARTIGGICSRTLRFGHGRSLEQLVLGQALGDGAILDPVPGAAGVMMLPIPARGILREVRGIDAARRVDLVEEVTMTMHRGDEVIPLPEGHRYLGFVFARGSTPEAVEHALRAAGALLKFEIEPV